MIVTIFGKKGSGKSVLSKNYMLSTGGRIIFLSPVETLSLQHRIVWEATQIPELMRNQKEGEILLIRLIDIDSLNLVCAQAISEPLGYTLLIDEMDKYNSSTQLRDVIHYSRHFNINIIANTRRYVDMPRLLTSQADELCVFKSQEPRDLDYLKQFTSKEFAVKCKDLPEYHYLHYPSNETLKAKYQEI